MNGERKKFLTEDSFGTLDMHRYNIDGNAIDAFYDVTGKLVFVLDNTINDTKPNVLLVIDSDGDKKWDEILSVQYGVNLETIRPKQDNKYQKLDIEYSGLSVYDNLIKAFENGDDLTGLLNQMNVLRDSAIRHSAMARLSNANEIITKTNATIVRTKETIIRLQERAKNLRITLAQQKKEIGRISTKQSAAKILKTESQIEATNEKLIRAKKRLESAMRRLENATADAELAENILNMPPVENKITTKPATQKQSVAVMPKYEIQPSEPEEDDMDEEVSDEELEEKNVQQEIKQDFDDTEETEEIEEVEESDIKPLFDKDPGILNENIAFKPISFDSDDTFHNIDAEFEESVKPEYEDKTEEEKNEEIEETSSEEVSEKPVLDFIAPVVGTTETETSPVDTPSTEPVVMPTSFPVPDQESTSHAIDSMDSQIQENSEPQEEIQNNIPESQTNNMEEPKMNENLPRPVSPILQEQQSAVNSNVTDVSATTERSKPTFIYYMLLLLLIGLSVFTLWLYQKNMNTSAPLLVAPTTETKAEQPERIAEQKTIVEVPEIQEDGFADVVFLDEEPTSEPEPVEIEEPVVEDTEEYAEYEEPEPVFEEPAPEEAIIEETDTEEPFVDEDYDSEEPDSVIIDESAVDKPVYETTSKHEDMFVYESDYVEPEQSDDIFYDENYDAEEAEYQAEQNYYE